jgi:hypothetical protein
MNSFVNYNTRSILLPPGCKNLIDVLQPGPSGEGGSSPVAWWKSPSKWVFHLRGLAHVEGYLSRLLQSSSKFAGLEIWSVDQDAGAIVIHSAGALKVMPIMHPWNVEREKRIRQLFDQEAIRPTVDIAPAGALSHALAYPLTDPAHSARITVELLRLTCDLTDESALRFLFHEVETA